MEDVQYDEQMAWYYQQRKLLVNFFNVLQEQKVEVRLQDNGVRKQLVFVLPPTFQYEPVGEWTVDFTYEQ